MGHTHTVLLHPSIGQGQFPTEEIVSAKMSTATKTHIEFLDSLRTQFIHLYYIMLMAKILTNHVIWVSWPFRCVSPHPLARNRDFLFTSHWGGKSQHPTHTPSVSSWLFQWVSDCCWPQGYRGGRQVWIWLTYLYYRGMLYPHIRMWYCEGVGHSFSSYVF